MVNKNCYVRYFSQKSTSKKIGTNLIKEFCMLLTTFKYQSSTCFNVLFYTQTEVTTAKSNNIKP